MSLVMVISGSPSQRSKTAMVGDYVVNQLALRSIEARHLAVQQLPAGPLLAGNCDDPQISEAIRLVEHADGLVIATPTFKASYSGLLKTFLDLLPQFAFARKAILPLATGGSMAHVLALDYGLRPVLQSMGARHIVQSYFILDKYLDATSGMLSIETSAEAPLVNLIQEFCDALKPPSSACAGH
jgi:FMN reductase